MAATHLSFELRCIKYLLCAVNFLLVFKGIVINFVGLKTLAIYNYFYYYFDRVYFLTPITIIGLGALISIIAFYGCCGAIRENNHMIHMFAHSLLVTLALQVPAVYMVRSLLYGDIRVLDSNINSSMYLYKCNSDDAAVIDFIQSRLHCCGRHTGVQNWSSKDCCTSECTYNSGNGMERRPYPDSCCAWTLAGPRSNNSGGYCVEPYDVGCVDRFSDLLHQSALGLRIIDIAGIALLELTAIVLAYTLGRAIRRQMEVQQRPRWENLVNGYQYLGKTDSETKLAGIYMLPEFPEKKPIDC